MYLQQCNLHMCEQVAVENIRLAEAILLFANEHVSEANPHALYNHKKGKKVVLEAHIEFYNGLEDATKDILIEFFDCRSIGFAPGSGSPPQPFDVALDELADRYGNHSISASPIPARNIWPDLDGAHAEDAPTLVPAPAPAPAPAEEHVVVARTTRYAESTKASSKRAAIACSKRTAIASAPKEMNPALSTKPKGSRSARKRDIRRTTSTHQPMTKYQLEQNQLHTKYLSHK